ncbi:MAG TPA: thiamine pyrophosphate-dependent enzyme, partial [Candidatus Thermoplasmatota archaeon]|nr:thiamine pyrophosphate-dependent enzyme [Candidatus Thermoplasmatota archaeon]
EGPTLVEAVTYRMRGHSSSDDPARYRAQDEVDLWARRDPLIRLRTYMGARGVWSEASERDLHAALTEEISEAIRRAEAAPAPAPDTLVTDVFKDVPWHLQRQFDELRAAHDRR